MPKDTFLSLHWENESIVSAASLEGKNMPKKVTKGASNFQELYCPAHLETSDFT